MGVDIAVGFLSDPVDPGRLALLAAAKGPDAERIYLVLGRPRAASCGKWFLGVWADGSVDLEGLYEELSKSGAACLTWKAEHGGAGGYRIWDGGSAHDPVSREGGDYFRLPAEGVEKAFGVKPELSDDDRFSFPEILFEDDVTCYNVTKRGAGVEAIELGRDDLNRLLEGDLDAEAVLPFE